jgi:hypothetical protein
MKDMDEQPDKLIPLPGGYRKRESRQVAQNAL